MIRPFSIGVAALAASVGLAHAEYRDARVVRVTAVNEVLLADGAATVTLRFPQLNAPSGCHNAWSTRWAQSLLPIGTAVKWFPDPDLPRLSVDLAGNPIDFTSASLGAGAASATPKVTDTAPFEWLQSEARARQLKLGVWATCGAEDVFETVAREKQVAKRLLFAVALTESGRQGAPWPWTLNVEGRALYFPTREAAHQSLVSYLKRGARSIDVGLMQVNLLHNGYRFANTWQALDPYENVRTGADILRQNFASAKDPALAVARYHSSTASRGQAYLGRVSQNYRKAASQQ